LKIHQRTHTGEKAFHCNICNKGLASKNSLVKHQKTHDEANNQSQKKSYVCEICEKEFTSGRGLSRHKRTHQKDASDSNDKDKSEVYDNEEDGQNFNEDINYVCSLCGYSFETDDSLQNHMKDIH
jgi:uncharacterized Zn-finger protein